MHISIGGSFSGGEISMRALGRVFREKILENQKSYPPVIPHLSHTWWITQRNSDLITVLTTLKPYVSRLQGHQVFLDFAKCRQDGTPARQLFRVMSAQCPVLWL
jgi:hypothetical protein